MQRYALLKIICKGGHCSRLCEKAGIFGGNMQRWALLEVTRKGGHCSRLCAKTGIAAGMYTCLGRFRFASFQLFLSKEMDYHCIEKPYILFLVQY